MTIRSLATDFEAAWSAEFDLPTDATDEQIGAAVARTNVCVEKILKVSGTDIQILRLKALAHIWAHGMPDCDSALASLFCDLGLGCPVAGRAGRDAEPATAQASGWLSGLFFLAASAARPRRGS